ncbi:uncharacterized protein LOC143921553 [Arctopsyche grandis]|uniref:uncharacterized protein LOC143921553 n=1 Tax=Arctopsyche grandis TaxID=121162 RepID=UPI00406D72E7
MEPPPEKRIWVKQLKLVDTMSTSERIQQNMIISEPSTSNTNPSEPTNKEGDNIDNPSEIQPDNLLNESDMFPHHMEQIESEMSKNAGTESDIESTSSSDGNQITTPPLSPSRNTTDSSISSTTTDSSISSTTTDSSNSSTTEEKRVESETDDEADKKDGSNSNTPSRDIESDEDCDVNETISSQDASPHTHQTQQMNLEEDIVTSQKNNDYDVDNDSDRSRSPVNMPSSKKRKQSTSSEGNVNNTPRNSESSDENVAQANRPQVTSSSHPYQTQQIHLEEDIVTSQQNNESDVDNDSDRSRSPVNMPSSKKRKQSTSSEGNVNNTPRNSESSDENVAQANRPQVASHPHQTQQIQLEEDIVTSQQDNDCDRSKSPVNMPSSNNRSRKQSNGSEGHIINTPRNLSGGENTYNQTSRSRFASYDPQMLQMQLEEVAAAFEQQNDNDVEFVQRSESPVNSSHTHQPHRMHLEEEFVPTEVPDLYLPRTGRPRAASCPTHQTYRMHSEDSSNGAHPHQDCSHPHQTQQIHLEEDIVTSQQNNDYDVDNDSDRSRSPVNMPSSKKRKQSTSSEGNVNNTPRNSESSDENVAQANRPQVTSSSHPHQTQQIHLEEDIVTSQQNNESDVDNDSDRSRSPVNMPSSKKRKQSTSSEGNVNNTPRNSESSDENVAQANRPQVASHPHQTQQIQLEEDIVTSQQDNDCDRSKSPVNMPSSNNRSRKQSNGSEGHIINTPRNLSGGENTYNQTSRSRFASYDPQMLQMQLEEVAAAFEQQNDNDVEFVQRSESPVNSSHTHQPHRMHLEEEFVPTEVPDLYLPRTGRPRAASCPTHQTYRMHSEDSSNGAHPHQDCSHPHQTQQIHLEEDIVTSQQNNESDVDNDSDRSRSPVNMPSSKNRSRKQSNGSEGHIINTPRNLSGGENTYNQTSRSRFASYNPQMLQMYLEEVDAAFEQQNDNDVEFVQRSESPVNSHTHQTHQMHLEEEFVLTEGQNDSDDDSSHTHQPHRMHLEEEFVPTEGQNDSDDDSSHTHQPHRMHLEEEFVPTEGQNDSDDDSSHTHQPHRMHLEEEFVPTEGQNDSDDDSSHTHQPHRMHLEEEFVPTEGQNDSDDDSSHTHQPHRMHLEEEFVPTEGQNDSDDDSSHTHQPHQMHLEEEFVPTEVLNLYLPRTGRPRAASFTHRAHQMHFEYEFVPFQQIYMPPSYTRRQNMHSMGSEVPIFNTPRNVECADEYLNQNARAQQIYMPPSYTRWQNMHSTGSEVPIFNTPRNAECADEYLNQNARARVAHQLHFEDEFVPSQRQNNPNDEFVRNRRGSRDNMPSSYTRRQNMHSTGSEVPIFNTPRNVECADEYLNQNARARVAHQLHFEDEFVPSQRQNNPNDEFVRNRRGSRDNMPSSYTRRQNMHSTGSEVPIFNTPRNVECADEYLNQNARARVAHQLHFEDEFVPSQRQNNPNDEFVRNRRGSRDNMPSSYTRRQNMHSTGSEVPIFNTPRNVECADEYLNQNARARVAHQLHFEDEFVPSQRQNNPNDEFVRNRRGSRDNMPSSYTRRQNMHSTGSEVPIFNTPRNVECADEYLNQNARARVAHQMHFEDEFVPSQRQNNPNDEFVRNRRGSRDNMPSSYTRRQNMGSEEHSTNNPRYFGVGNQYIREIGRSRISSSYTHQTNQLQEEFIPSQQENDPFDDFLNESGDRVNMPSSYTRRHMQSMRSDEHVINNPINFGYGDDYVNEGRSRYVPSFTQSYQTHLEEDFVPSQQQNDPDEHIGYERSRSRENMPPPYTQRQNMHSMGSEEPIFNTPRNLDDNEHVNRAGSSRDPPSYTHQSQQTNLEDDFVPSQRQNNPNNEFARSRSREKQNVQSMALEEHSNNTPRNISMSSYRHRMHIQSINVEEHIIDTYRHTTSYDLPFPNEAMHYTESVPKDTVNNTDLTALPDPKIIFDGTLDIFNAMLNCKISEEDISDYIRTWSNNYNLNKIVALQKLVQFFFICCGQRYSLIFDPTTFNVGDIVKQVTMHFKEYNDDSKYPLISSRENWKRFFSNTLRLIGDFVVQHHNSIILDDFFTKNIFKVLFKISTSPVLTLRHTASLIAVKFENALADACVNIIKDLNILKERKESELQKDIVDVSALDIIAEEENSCKKHMDYLEELICFIFKDVTFPRKEDSSMDIKLLILDAMAINFEKLPTLYVNLFSLKIVDMGFEHELKIFKLKSLNILQSLLLANLSIDIKKIVITYSKRTKDRIISLTKSDDSDVSSKSISLIILIHKKIPDMFSEDVLKQLPFIQEHSTGST